MLIKIHCNFFSFLGSLNVLESVLLKINDEQNTANKGVMFQWDKNLILYKPIYSIQRAVPHWKKKNPGL